MTEQPMSRQEMIRRRRRTGFVGRREELAAFRANFARRPQDEDCHFLFHVHGNAGVGKSSLVRQWEAVAREQGAVTASVGDEVHSVLEAMEAVSVRFSRQGAALKGFDRMLALYRQRRHEAEAASGPDGSDEPSRPPSAAGTLAAQVGLAGLGLVVPGAGAITGAVSAQQVAAGADRLRAVLSSRLRNHDDVRLVMSPLAVLTPKFLDDLADLAARRPWVVLFFDTYERTGPLLDTWLRDVMVTETYGVVPVNLQVVLAGQGRLDPHCWGDWLDLVAHVPLEVFTEDEARTLLAARGVTDERVVEVVLRLSGRLPVLVDTLARSRPHTGAAIEDPSDTAVERFLKWEADPDRRAVALACALPLRLNEDVHDAAVVRPVDGGYRWLRGLPFVNDQGDWCRYHDVVRAPMLRVQRAQSPVRWADDHDRLAAAFRRWREALEATLPASGRWDDSAWREHRLNETYHRLCSDPRQGLPAALHDAVEACGAGVAVLRRWCDLFSRAGEDAGSAGLGDLGRRLREAADDEDGPLGALGVLLSLPDTAPATRALAHAVRGRTHADADRAAAALPDFEAALALDPDLVTALLGRGGVHARLGHYDEALADHDRAIALDPAGARAFADRGQIHRRTGRRETAVADYDRAIALDPAFAWAIADRGETYRQMRRFDEALADFDRAVEIQPDYTWAIANRGLTYRLLGRLTEAVDEFDRAVELNPEYAWAIANRGLTRRLLGHHEQALTDFGRAIGLEPRYTWAIANRGLTYRLLERHEQALADYDLAIRLQPALAWAIANRGLTYQFLGHHAEALADFDRAVDLKPDYAWAITHRAWLHRLMDRPDRAAGDFDRALALDPGLVQALAGRAEVRRLLGRLDEALADCEQAIRLDPGDGRTWHQKAVVLRLLGSGEAPAVRRRAVELLTEAADGTGESAVAARGDLLAALCALPADDRAAEQLDRFLAAAPPAHVIRQALLDLTDLRQTLSAVSPALDSLRHRLSEALETDA